MTTQDAFKRLGIEKYAERIYNSNSHGELFHLFDYIQLAENLSDEVLEFFPEWFEAVVRHAEENWGRPESIFQHIGRAWNELIDHALGNR